MTASSRRRTAQPSARAIAPDVAATSLCLSACSTTAPRGCATGSPKRSARIAPSFSQMANPAYPTPAPARHLEIIFELCHFSKAERAEFLAAYLRAHPRRLHLVLRRGAHA